MFKSQHNFFNYCPNHGGIIPPESIRFIPETFGDPERSFAYLALVSFLWPPSKFVQEHRDLTLTEINRRFENHLVADGYSRGVISHVFQKQRLILGQPSPRDRAPGNPRPLGNYKLHEFFAIDGEKEVRTWCWPAAARIAAARKKAIDTDPVFDQFWIAQYPHLVCGLKAWVKEPYDPEDIAQSAWLAIRIAHDTGDSWDFKRLRHVALDIYRREPGGRSVEFFDELLYDGPFETAPQRRIPRYVKIAVLQTLLDGARLPHEIVNFLHRFLTLQPPRTIVKLAGDITLFELICHCFALFLPKSSLPDSVVRQLFTRFDRRLGLPFRRVTSHKGHLRTHRALLNKTVGWTCLKDYMKSTTADGQAAEISDWWLAVLYYLKLQADEPDTPLNLALRRWRIEGDEDEDLEENDDGEPSESSEPSAGG